MNTQLLLPISAALVVLASCQVGSVDPVCEISHSGLNAEGEQVIVCEKFHATAPYVRPEKLQGAYIGGLDNEGLFTFRNGDTLETVTLLHRDGRPFACGINNGLDVFGNPNTANECDPVAGNTASDRRIYTLYKVEGSFNAGDKTLSTGAITPYLVATPDAIDSLLNRPFTGSANFRKADYNPDTDGIFSYEESSTPVLLLPVRQADLQVYGPTAKTNATLEKTRPTVFKVANYNQATLAAKGSCYPALTSFGLRNPLLHLQTNEARLARHASMHAPGTHTITLEPTDLEASPQDGWHFAIGSGAMSGEMPAVMFKPATWLSSQIDLNQELTMVQHIHAIPNGLHFALTPATTDSQTGQPCP